MAKPAPLPRSLTKRPSIELPKIVTKPMGERAPWRPGGHLPPPDKGKKKKKYEPNIPVNLPR